MLYSVKLKIYGDILYPSDEDIDVKIAKDVTNSDFGELTDIAVDDAPTEVVKNDAKYLSYPVTGYITKTIDGTPPLIFKEAKEEADFGLLQNVRYLPAEFKTVPQEVPWRLTVLKTYENNDLEDVDFKADNYTKQHIGDILSQKYPDDIDVKRFDVKKFNYCEGEIGGEKTGRVIVHLTPLPPSTVNNRLFEVALSDEDLEGLRKGLEKAEKEYFKSTRYDYSR